jgi:hypothetical protein
MFISKAEKELLFFRIDQLQERMEKMAKYIMEKESKKPKTRTMSPEARAKISAMMKKRHADAKAKKENA